MDDTTPHVALSMTRDEALALTVFLADRIALTVRGLSPVELEDLVGDDFAVACEVHDALSEWLGEPQRSADIVTKETSL